MAGTSNMWSGDHRHPRHLKAIYNGFIGTDETMIRDQLISNRQYSQGLVLQNLAIFFGVELIFHVELQKIHIRE